MSTSVSDRLASVITPVPAEELLLPGLASGVALVTDAELDSRLPDTALAGTATTRVATRLTPTAVAPAQVHTTGPLPLQVPPGALEDTKLVPAGTASVTATSVALSPPAFATVAV